VRLVQFSNGRQLKHFINLSKTSAEIITSYFDPVDNFVYLCDSTGYVRALNLTTGSLAADLHWHIKPATSFHTLSKQNLLTTVHENFKIIVQKKDIYDTQILRELSNPCGVEKAKCSDISFHLNSVGVATDEIIFVYSFDRFKLRGLCAHPGMKSISQLRFLSPYSILAAITEKGEIWLYSLGFNDHEIVSFRLVGMVRFELAPGSFLTGAVHFVKFSENSAIYLTLCTSDREVYVLNLWSFIEIKTRVKPVVDLSNTGTFLPYCEVQADGAALFKSKKASEHKWVKQIIEENSHVEYDFIPAKDPSILVCYFQVHVRKDMQSYWQISCLKVISIEGEAPCILFGTSSGEIRLYTLKGELVA